MGIDDEVLILGPFKEVIERGKEAVANAGGAGDEDVEHSKLMLKAAQGVVREGERALKRLQPLWDSQVEKYGEAFKTGVSQNGGIEDKRRKLEDILYDFEDYVEADTFEAARFADLQAATKALALNVIDLIKKMKLEPPKSPAYSAPTSSSKFPPLPPLPQLPIATRSPSGSSTVPSTPATTGRSPQPRRRPPTPVGNRSDRSQSPRPSLPLKSPDRHQAPSSPTERDQDVIPSALPSSSMDASSDAIPQPLRINPPSSSSSRRSHSQLMSMNSIRSQRSATSIVTSRSRMSLASAGSIESMPPPAYTAPGEAVIPAPSQDEPSLQPSTSRAPTPEQQQRRSRALSQDGHPPTSPPGLVEATGSVHYSVFPTVQRAGHGIGGGGSSGTRTTAWVSDQAEPASRLPTTAHQQQVHRPGSRYEPPHSQQALQSLQSLTIPEDKAVGVVGVRPKHSSVIDFSPLTPMLSQLQLGQFGSGSSSIGPASVASSPSVDTSSPGADRARMSPLSQATSISSLYHSKPEPPLPLQTPDETIETRMDPLRVNPTLTPLSLPAAALEQSLPPTPGAQTASSPRSQIPPAIPEEWHLHEPPATMSDHASIAGFSSSSLTSSSQPGSGVPQPREPDTAVGPRSSLYQLDGFCGGAQTFKASAHQDGVQRVAGHVAGVSTATARCAHCSYGHAFAELDLDVNDKSPRATFARPGGVLFRIRLLYKSHLAARRPSEAFYGCLFCAQAGAVPREGDATVFRSSDDLLRHLARHPQPLPEVPGVTVLYGKEVLTTDPRVNDFDVWLTEDPQPSAPTDPATVMMMGANRLPFATASRSHVQRYAEKRLPRPDGKSAASLLQFFTGARIIGVEFPRAFGGKWCTGWHDGEWGYFPAKAIELEKPKPGRLDAPPLQFQAASAVSVSVVARWRWDPAASIRDAVEKGWMGFDKGERITNVGWPVLVEGVGGGGREAWCWSGTNAKGKFGVFPRSHVDEATLRDDMRPATMGGGGDGGARKKKEGGGKGSGKSLFGVRRRASTASSRSGGGIAEII